MSTLGKHEQFQMYCSNLTNYLPSYERLKTQSSHRKVLNENTSYFKLKKIEHKGFLRKLNAQSLSDASKCLQQQFDNQLIYSKINTISSRKPEGIHDSTAVDYFNSKMNCLKVMKTLEQEKLKNENNKLYQRLKEKKSIIGNKANKNFEIMKDKAQQSEKVYYNLNSQKHYMKWVIKERPKIEGAHYKSCSHSGNFSKDNFEIPHLTNSQSQPNQKIAASKRKTPKISNIELINNQKAKLTELIENNLERTESTSGTDTASLLLNSRIIKFTKLVDSGRLSQIYC